MPLIAGHSLDKVLDDVRRLRQDERRTSEVAPRPPARRAASGPPSASIGGHSCRLDRGFPARSPTRVLTETLLSGRFAVPLPR